MAAYNKFNSFVEYLCDKVMDLFGIPVGDTIKLALSNTAPLATNTVFADIVEIPPGNGYSAGGNAVTADGVRSGGTVTFRGDKVTWTATGGSIGPFRYAVLYDDTPIAPADPLIAWWDHGSSITLNAGDTFTVKFNNADVDGTIFTLS